MQSSTEKPAKDDVKDESQKLEEPLLSENKPPAKTKVNTESKPETVESNPVRNHNILSLMFQNIALHGVHCPGRSHGGGVLLAAEVATIVCCLLHPQNYLLALL